MKFIILFEFIHIWYNGEHIRFNFKQQKLDAMIYWCDGVYIPGYSAFWSVSEKCSQKALGMSSMATENILSKGDFSFINSNWHRADPNKYIRIS